MFQPGKLRHGDIKLHEQGCRPATGGAGLRAPEVMVAVVCSPSRDENPNVIFSLWGYPGILDVKWWFFNS